MTTSNGSVLQSAVETLQARTERLLQIGKRQNELTKSQAAIDAEQNKLNAEIAKLTGNAPATGINLNASKPKGKKGRPVGSKNGVHKEKPAKTPKAPKAKKEHTPRGLILKDVLLEVMPGVTENAISKDDIVTLAKKAGWVTKAGDPKVVVSQCLTMNAYFKNPARGVWQLSQSGENARNKARTAATAEAAEAAEAAEIVSSPAVEAPVASVTPAAEPAGLAL